MKQKLTNRSKGSATPIRAEKTDGLVLNGQEIDLLIDKEVVYEFGGPIGVSFMVNSLLILLNLDVIFLLSDDLFISLY